MEVEKSHDDGQEPKESTMEDNQQIELNHFCHIVWN